MIRFRSRLLAPFRLLFPHWFHKPKDVLVDVNSLGHSVSCATATMRFLNIKSKLRKRSQRAVLVYDYFDLSEQIDGRLIPKHGNYLLSKADAAVIRVNGTLHMIKSRTGVPNAVAIRKVWDDIHKEGLHKVGKYNAKP